MDDIDRLQTAGPVPTGRVSQGQERRRSGGPAGSLNSLGNPFSGPRRPTDALPPAQEAVEAVRRLAETNADRYFGDLAEH